MIDIGHFLMEVYLGCTILVAYTWLWKMIVNIEQRYGKIISSFFCSGHTCLSAWITIEGSGAGSLQFHSDLNLLVQVCLKLVEHRSNEGRILEIDN